MITLFWISFFLIFYTFFGYGIVLYVLVKLKRVFFPVKRKQFDFDNLPSCTIVVAAFNEQDFIEAKIKNTLALKYPAAKLEFLFVTDGSSDLTPEIVSRYPQIKLMHSPERKGKIAAVHRAIQAGKF